MWKTTTYLCDIRMPASIRLQFMGLEMIECRTEKLYKGLPKIRV